MAEPVAVLNWLCILGVGSGECFSMCGEAGWDEMGRCVAEWAGARQVVLSQRILEI